MEVLTAEDFPTRSWIPKRLISEKKFFCREVVLRLVSSRCLGQKEASDCETLTRRQMDFVVVGSGEVDAADSAEVFLQKR